mmetsp:Transcript_50844/g.58763  ORF Transcript_50844/g.58763 Transcript_50844/m.58763 type:complete len:633 (-) Transcript_50844:145-2043(-)
MSFFFRNNIRSRRKKNKGRVNTNDVISESYTVKQSSLSQDNDEEKIIKSQQPIQIYQTDEEDDDDDKTQYLHEQSPHKISNSSPSLSFVNINNNDQTAYGSSATRKGQHTNMKPDKGPHLSSVSQSKTLSPKDSHGKQHFLKSLWRKSDYERDPQSQPVPSSFSTYDTLSKLPVKQGQEDRLTDIYEPTEPKPIQIDFHKDDQTKEIGAKLGSADSDHDDKKNQHNLRSNIRERSAIPFLANKDSSELRKGTRNKQQKSDGRTNNLRNNNTKTVVMNGDIVVCTSYNSKLTSDTATVLSIASSSNKARILQRESERNARAAISLDNKGNELFEKGYFDKAMACYTKALKLKRRTFAHLLEDADCMEEQLMQRENSNTDPQILVSMATSINNIGYLRQRSGDATPEETMAAYRKSLRIKRRILGDDSLSVGKTLNNIGSVHYLKRDFNRALPAYEEAIEIMKANLGSDHPDVATVMSNIGDVYLARGDLKTSLQNYRLALAIRWEKFGEKSPRVIRLLEKISNLEIGDRMMSSTARKNKSQQAWDEDETSEALESGYHPITDDLKLLQEQVTKDIEQVNKMESKATVEMLKDKIIIIRGMRDTWNGNRNGPELLDNDSASVMTAMSRRSKGCV